MSSHSRAVIVGGSVSGVVLCVVVAARFQKLVQAGAVRSVLCIGILYSVCAD